MRKQVTDIARQILFLRSTSQSDQFVGPQHHKEYVNSIKHPFRRRGINLLLKQAYYSAPEESAMAA
jgi:hypothetical protein